MKQRLRQVGAFFYGGKGTFYRKSLILILIVTGIPGLIMGGLIYWFSVGRIEAEMVRLHENQIERRAADVNDEFARLELSLSHWAFDPKFDHSLKEADFLKQFQKTKEITLTLGIMQGSAPITKRMEFFVEGKAPVFFNPEFNILMQDKDIELYRQLLTDGPLVHWTTLPSGASSYTNDLALIHKMPGGTSQPFGVIVARLDRDKVISLLKTLNPLDEGEVFLMREDGSVLLSTDSGQASPSPLMEQLRTAVLEAKSAGGRTSFAMDWDNSPYSVSFGEFDRVGTKWIYVSAAPLSIITSPVVFVSKVIVIVSLVVLALAAVLAWIASRRIYSPLERLVRLLAGEQGEPYRGLEDEFKLIERQWQHLNRESLTLQTKLEAQLPQVKEGFLMQLVHGYLASYTEDDLTERMKQFGWQTEGRQYFVMLVQLTGMTMLDRAGRFSLEDEGLVTFAAANIIEELARERFAECDVINFHDLTVGLLISTEKESGRRDELFEMGDAIIQAVDLILKMQVTVSVGSSTESIKQIPFLFGEARLALSLRSFGEGHQMIDLEAAAQEERAIFQYPFALERELIQAMRMGNQEEAERLLDEFLGALTSDGSKELDVQQGVFNLLGSLEHAMMQSGVNPNQLFKGANRFEQLAQMRETERIRDWFASKVISPYIQETARASGSQIKRTIERAMQYIQDNYHRDISLDDCAEHCGTNAFVLSRSFKQVTGKNFIDYLTELRVEKAKELLRDSERKINEIAEQVGYQHSYFNRIFKKYEGVTPSRYREMVRQG